MGKYCGVVTNLPDQFAFTYQIGGHGNFFVQTLQTINRLRINASRDKTLTTVTRYKRQDQSGNPQLPQIEVPTHKRVLLWCQTRGKCCHRGRRGGRENRGDWSTHVLRKKSTVPLAFYIFITKTINNKKNHIATLLYLGSSEVRQHVVGRRNTQGMSDRTHEIDNASIFVIR